MDNAAPQNPDKFPLLICGNKSDLSDQRAVTREEAEDWCKSNGGLPYYETDSLQGVGLDDLFNKCGSLGLADFKQGGDEDELPTSLSGAAGAIKLDPSKEEEIVEKQQEKKKKKCKC